MSSFGGDFRLGITAFVDLCLAKIPSACVFIAFQLARVGRSRRLLTVKISRRLFNFSAGWSFGEAQPRGLLYHRYRINDQGIVQSARIVPPTCQNYRRIEDDLRVLLPSILDRTDAEIIDTCEKLVRNYDPCISCSTHAVKIQINRSEVPNLSRNTDEHT